MKSTKLVLRLLTVFLFVTFSANANAQFFKKLGKKIEQGIEKLGMSSNSRESSFSYNPYSSNNSQNNEANVQNKSSSAGDRKTQIAHDALDRWKNNAKKASDLNSDKVPEVSTSNSIPNSKDQMQEARWKVFNLAKKNVVGQFNTCSRVRNLYVIFNSDSTVNSYWIEPTQIIDIWGGNGGNSRGDAMFQISASSYETLKEISLKYKEWIKVAEDNKVGNFEKAIPIDLSFGFLFFVRDKLIKCDKCASKEFIFIRNGNNHGSLFISQDWSDRGVDETANLRLMFLTPEEFDKFVELFNPSKLQEYLNFQKSGGLFH